MGLSGSRDFCECKICAWNGRDSIVFGERLFVYHFLMHLCVKLTPLKAVVLINRSQTR
jgi:hypothetical protein